MVAADAWWRDCSFGRSAATGSGHDGPAAQRAVRPSRLPRDKKKDPHQIKVGVSGASVFIREHDGHDALGLGRVGGIIGRQTQVALGVILDLEEAEPAAD